ncbi:hypothetical protein ACFVVX_02730 [Kitasatospora sp. NPDC058170]|uniref:hypothetical protein n=1 Tax=Kitasatospora sp. NPDC058170 TaxID=3346364 RepID=UPI0036D804E0
MMVHHWLLKPGRMVQGTWASAVEAVGWLAGEWRRLDAPPPLAAALSEADRCRSAQEQLEQGDDAVWAGWLPGGRFVSLAAVCCPHRGLHGPALPCPSALGASAGPAPGKPAGGRYRPPGSMAV